MRGEVVPVVIRVCQNRKRALLKTLEGNWAGWLQRWLFGAHAWVNGVPRFL